MRPVYRFKRHFSNLNERVKALKDDLNTVQASIQVQPMNLELATKEKDLIIKYNKVLHHEEASLKKKACDELITLGDGNNTYFFRKMKARAGRNRIHRLTDKDGVLWNDEEQIKEIILQYYQDLQGKEHCEEMVTSDLLNGLQYSAIKEDDMSDLVKDVTVEEIKGALFSIKDNKAAGPDGFSAYFFKKNWDVIQEDFCLAVLNFFRTGKMLRCVNTTNICLVPKKEYPSSLAYYRLIACTNVIYKVIVKVMVNRLKNIFPDIISPNQFVKERNIADNILLSHEMVRKYGRKSISSRSTIKIDLTKAYDFVRWEAIEHMMRIKGFPGKMIDWIKACYSTLFYSIIVSGEPHGFFNGTREIRQGDPLSPLLFVLVMEIFSKLMDSKVLDGFTPHPKCKDPLVTHLCYADDLMIFSAGDVESAVAIKKVLDDFKKNSGLSTDVLKSTVSYGGGSDIEKEEFACTLGMELNTSCLTYLGLPLLSSRLTRSDCLICGKETTD
ncbi:hypothetical protein ACHQM5_023319 [Ranunculus cassubicifolius]